MNSPLDQNSEIYQQLQPAGLINANKLDSERRGLIQMGMNTAQAVDKAAQNTSNMYFSKGGSVMSPSKKEERERFKQFGKAMDKELVPALVSDRDAIEQAVAGTNALKVKKEKLQEEAKAQKPAPLPKRKPTVPDEAPKSERRMLAVSPDISGKDLKKILAEISAKPAYARGGIMSYADGGSVPPGALEDEVADDIEANLSEGEFVFSADVTRFYGLECLVSMVKRAREALEEYAEDGMMGPTKASKQGLLGRFIQDEEPDLDAYEEQEFGPNYAQGGPVSSVDGGVLGTDISYARGGLMKKASQKL